MVRGIAFRVPCPIQPPLRRRIPNVIRRRHLGFLHGRHQERKAMCRHIPETTPQHREDDQGQNLTVQLCNLRLTPSPRLSPGGASQASNKSCAYQAVKAMCHLNETDNDNNGSATGYSTRNRVQSTVNILNPEAGRLPASGFRHTVLIGTI